MHSLIDKISAYYSAIDSGSYHELLELLNNSKIVACQLA